MRQFLFLSSLFVAVAGLSPAETQSQPESQHSGCGVWGQVVSSDHLNADGFEIEIAGNAQASRQRTRVVDGVFDFQPVPAGTYQFRLFDRSGQVILRYKQSLNGSDDDVILRLPYARPEPPSENVVSLAELRHKVPRQAADAFHAGLKAVDSDDVQKSIEHFQKAVSIDSQYVEAENNLAVLYNRIGRREEALQHAQRAFEINPVWAETGHTLAVLLIAGKRYVQTEELARAMLANQRAVPEMHAYLAISLIGQRRSFDEAFGHIRLAAEEFPMARLLAANTLIEIGLPAVAAVQVNGYLQSAARGCERAVLERWMAQLDRSLSKAAANATRAADATK
jgi:tetratricopeptide (TPR) repeat protein